MSEQPQQDVNVNDADNVTVEAPQPAESTGSNETEGSNDTEGNEGNEDSASAEPTSNEDGPTDTGMLHE